LVPLELELLRERHDHVHVQVVAQALAVLERAVVEPHLACEPRNLPVVSRVLLHDRNNVTVNVHGALRIPGVDGHPPAIAPTIMNGLAPVATGSGSGVSGGSKLTSSSQAKNRTIGRRLSVP